jgi:ATP-dependent RNA helicase HelY
MSSPGHPFVLDPFQRRALEVIDAGRSVLVAAPTGSGKTVVAEHAVARALAEGGKAFYTTPIKALSNQKYHDLVARHGAERVGLLTGDNAVNGDAPVVVMTTEVLRNMVYARSAALDGLRFVVLDEVHYLQDAYRGPVWEEVIVHLPAEVRLVCLSATVSNAGELADWIGTVRGPTDVVVEERRPVELENLYAIDDRTADELRVIPVLVDGRPNRAGSRYDVDRREPWRGGRPRRRYATPRRIEVVERLGAEGLLPTIYFIFSRAACDDAVTSIRNAGIRLTTADERERIRAIAERHVEDLGDDDLAVLDYADFATSLESGVAAHHAGMVPPFKEAVEACFVAGLVKVVFATETLALGINMPARSVVIEKLTKFTGERHEFLTPAQYTQLTGRAGRRGIDDHGSALVLWSPFVWFEEIAALAGSRSFRLTSSFRPTYNMAANLVRRYPAEEARHLLNLSFAQYQADREIVALESRLDRREALLAEARAAATCERGDAGEYRRLVEATRSPAGRAESTDRDVAGSTVETALRRVKPGDVLWVGGRGGGKVAVLSVAHRKGGAVRVRAVTSQRRVLHLGAADFDEPPEVLATVSLPSPFAPKSSAFQKAVSQALHRVDVRPPRASRRARRGRGGGAEHPGHDHPVASCPDRDEHLRAARRADRLQAEVDATRRRIAGRHETLARAFERILELLEAWGHLDGWRLTARGEQLVRIYHECDLLIAECLDEGLLDGLDPPALAGLVSTFTYEHRSSTPPPEPWFPSRELAHRFDRIDRLAIELNEDERRQRLPPTRRPDPGFLPLAHAWAAGDRLDHVLEDEDLSGGDFVRNAKQLLDLLRQVADATSVRGTADAARRAAEEIFRGVVAASSAVSTTGNEGEGVDDDVPDDDVPAAPRRPEEGDPGDGEAGGRAPPPTGRG